MEHKGSYLMKSFALPHNNGEMWGSNLDALGGQTDALERRFLEDMAVIRRPSSPGIIAMNLYQTVVTQELADLMMAQLNDAGPRVTRVAFIGLDRSGLRHMKDAGKRHNVKFVHKYFADFVLAKDWLIPPR